MAIFTYNSNDTYTPSVGVLSVIVECWGGGGKGSGVGGASISGYAGGGGGAYAKSRVSVIPGDSYPIVVGGQATASDFNTNEVKAAGGVSRGTDDNTAGAGGAIADCIYNIIAYKGGDGGVHTGVPGSAGAGGGEGAGTDSDGHNGSNAVDASVGAGGTGGDGGDGGTGGFNQPGNAGSVTGGGGGGASRGNGGAKAGGAGAAGQVRITELFSFPLPTFLP